ncbi:MAG: type II toxin-antitoxin system mRNA interferase toxin, RelE/StbE family [Patescibacteria group bacterium]
MLIVEVSSRFHRSFRHLPLRVQDDFQTRITRFQLEPFDPTLRTHKLSGGLEGHYSFSLTDGHRVLFEFMSDNVVLLVNVGSHDAYKKWPR